MYKIIPATDVPTFARRGGQGRPPKYPFGTMEVGEGLFLYETEAPLARTAASQFKRNHPGWNYETRKTDGGVYLRRTA